LPFYVTLPHDSQWYFPAVEPHPMPSIPITATVHGGKPPYNYIWYDMDSNKVLQSSSSNTYYVTWSPTYLSKLRVLAVDGGDSTATDYMCIYEICNPDPLRKPVHHTATSVALNAIAAKVKVYPNPNTGQFKVELAGIQNVVSTIEIYNMLGEKVVNKKLLENTDMINMSNQSDGVYFYRVILETGELIGSGKIIVEK
jgi:hypothetical protein